MAFDEGANTNATLALVRLMRRVEALEKELNGLREAQRIAQLQRTVDNAKRPKRGDRGDKGDKGDKGERGATGPMPDHKWQGTRLAFEKPDGTWAIGVDLRGPSGGGYSVMGGGSGGVALPSGGTTGQVLKKASNADNDVEWATDATGSAALSDVEQVSDNYVFPTSDPQIELAVNTLGAKINEIIDALS